MRSMDSEEARAPFVDVRPDPDRTAQRNPNLLMATQCVFLFSHGILVTASSLALALEIELSWWIVFLPVWLGNALCLMMLVTSWFASCPYIKLCIAERQTRLGERNPSIVTELLPNILLATLGLFLVTLALVGELLLCNYLEARRLHEHGSAVPAFVCIMTAAAFACCRGMCIFGHGDIFANIGGSTLLTLAFFLLLPDGVNGSGGWILALPSLLGVLGLLISAVARLHRFKLVLYPEERRLYVAEQVVLLVLFIALLTIIIVHAGRQEVQNDWGATVVGSLFAGLGGGISIISLLRARLSFVEQRCCSIRERVLIQAMGQQSRSTLEGDVGFPNCLRRGAGRGRRPSESTSNRSSARVIATRGSIEDAHNASNGVSPGREPDRLPNSHGDTAPS